MILKSVEINNIRSIRNIEIEFPKSTILFYGDIGAGKSSVLKAIEFSLFGFLPSADLAGDSLLRRGEDKGYVKLVFSIDDKEYTIARFIEKNNKGTITQTKASYTIVDGAKEALSIQAMRRKILDILNYSVIRYEKAKKVPLFRYTVYTPQEQVKEILHANPEERFEILKEVFGIEKYEIALKNASIVKDYLSQKSREISGRIQQIGTPEEIIPQRETEIEDYKSQIESLKKKSEEQDTKLQEELDKLEKSEIELSDYKIKIKEIDRKEREIKEVKRTKESNEKEFSQLLKEISNFEQELKSFSIVEPEIKLSENDINTEIRNARSKISTNKQEKAVLAKNIDDIDRLLQKGMCSLCGQKIHEKDRFEKEKEKALKKIDGLVQEIENLTQKMEEMESNLQILSEYNKTKRERDSIQRLLDEKKKRKKNLENLISEIDKSEDEITSILEEYKITDLNQFRNKERELSQKNQEIRNKINRLKSEKDDFEKQILIKKKDIDYLNNSISELKDLIDLRKELDQKMELMENLKGFTTENFPSLIRDIEKKILASSARQFNLYFKEWFRILVEEENIEVEIRLEDFQPIINVNGHESPFNDLSGGEKSALSLAYRLALNKIINERYQEITTKNLLILDEPTDGFSQQQINRMQGIFNKLNMAQTIIISHERTLDSFVTDIFEFTKINHATSIRIGRPEMLTKPTITALKCPACDAQFDVSTSDKNIIVCEYCKKPFLVNRAYT